MVGEHPGNGGLPFLGMWVTILSIDGDHSWEYGSYPWPLSPGRNVVSLVYVSNSKSVVHFLLVDFVGCVDNVYQVIPHLQSALLYIHPCTTQLYPEPLCLFNAIHSVDRLRG